MPHTASTKAKPRLANALAWFVCMMAAFVAGLQHASWVLVRPTRTAHTVVLDVGFLTDTRGALSAASLSTLVLGILGAILLAVVGMALLAGLAPTYFTNLAALVGLLNDPNTTTGDTTGDALLPIFALVSAIMGTIGILVIILGVVVVKAKGGLKG